MSLPHGEEECYSLLESLLKSEPAEETGSSEDDRKCPDTEDLIRYLESLGPRIRPHPLLPTEPSPFPAESPETVSSQLIQLAKAVIGIYPQGVETVMRLVAESLLKATLIEFISRKYGINRCELPWTSQEMFSLLISEGEVDSFFKFCNDNL